MKSILTSVTAFALAAINLCLTTDAANAVSHDARALSPQHSNCTPYSMNHEQFEKKHPEFLWALEQTTEAQRETNPVSYPNSMHSPSGMSKNQNRKIDIKKLGKVGVQLGGTGPKGPCIGKNLGPGQTSYENKDPRYDGNIDMGGGRAILPKSIEMNMTCPEQVGICAEASRAFKDTPNENSAVTMATIEEVEMGIEEDGNSEVGRTMQKTQAAMNGMAEMASEAMASEFNFTWLKMLRLSSTPLINVGNTASGSPCNSSKGVKTHSNAVYMVQQAYSHIYLPIALLLLLPGAVATQLKSMLSSGILNNQNDDDAVSPFTGILRVLVAIFLIPASQLIVSYSIDVGNSLQHEISSHINFVNIFMYADEQVFSPPEDSFPGKLLPSEALESLGKLSGTPEKLAKRFNMSMASVMLQMVANSISQGAAFGIVVACAFQTVMACYLLLMGPIAAALYAWPTGAGSLFTRVFAGWVDGMVNLSLWRFWWCVVLLVMDTRLGWLSGAGLLDICSMWELLMFISFLVIMTTVPFNPFDFKAGDMVHRIMDKADEAVQETSNKK